MTPIHDLKPWLYINFKYLDIHLNNYISDRDRKKTTCTDLDNIS